MTFLFIDILSFVGLFKSKVTCLKCENSSITFDPYMFLSVPIPDTRIIDIDVNAVSLFNSLGDDEFTELGYFGDPVLDMFDSPTSGGFKDVNKTDSHLKKLTITLPRSATIKDLIEKAVSILRWDPSIKHKAVCLKLNQIHAEYQDSDLVNDLKKYDDLYMYQVNNNQDEHCIPVYFSRKPTTSYEPARKLFGIPMFLNVPKLLEIKYFVNMNASYEDKVFAQETGKFTFIENKYK